MGTLEKLQDNNWADLNREIAWRRILENNYTSQSAGGRL